MRVLLVGEFSRLHNSLKEGLIQNGHQVTLIGSGDYFKKYPVDIIADGYVVKNNWLLQKIRRLLYILTKVDLAGLETLVRLYKNKKNISNYDIVQFINEAPFKSTYSYEKKLLDFILKRNKDAFLLSCGEDYNYVSFAINKKFPYSVLTPYLEDNTLQNNYKYTLEKLSDEYNKVHTYMFSKINGVIPVSLEYEIVYKGHVKKLPMTPNPINTDKIKFAPIVGENKKIIILLGVNTVNYWRKGYSFFEKAIEYITEKYPDKVEVITTKNLPYNTYVTYLESAHILLDQTYAHDQGYNALEAMAMGKVVFTGGGSLFRARQ